MEETFERYQEECRILRELMQALEYEPVKAAIAEFLGKAEEEPLREWQRDVMDGKRTGLFGDYKEFHYSPYSEEEKNKDIRKELIELINRIDFKKIDIDWNTLDVIFHDYLDEMKPMGPSTIAIKYRGNCTDGYTD